MTENEAMRFIGQAVIESEKALEALQSIKSEAERIGKIGEYYANLDNCVKEIEACRVAIQALEEIQAYRAIGTIEELKAIKNDGGFTDDLLNMGYTKGIKDGYADAIDEFAEQMKWEYRESIGTSAREINFACGVIDQVAERLKGVQE